MEDLISFSAQVKFLSDIAHIEQLFAVFLQQERCNVVISGWNGDKKWPVNHTFGDKDSPAHENISNKE
jgi:hypothetical protein